MSFVSGALLASAEERNLVFDPYNGSGTAAVATKELNRAFIGVRLEEEFAKLAARRIAMAQWGSFLRESSEEFCTMPSALAVPRLTVTTVK